MLRKDLMGALREARTALRLAVEVGCPYFEALCRLALARVLADCNDERKCAAQLRQMRDIVGAIDNRHLEYACLTVFAGIALEHGRPRSGLNALRRAFALGREYGYTHFQWWLPQDMGRLCAHAIGAGIEPDYARDLVRRRRLMPGGEAPAPDDWPWAFRVATLGGFRLLRQGEPLAASGKAQRRPLELLKVLIAYGGEGVAEERIADAVWPRIPGDSAHRSFTSTLHRLRKLLGEDKALVLHEGKLSFDRRYVWTDVWEFEARAEALEAARARRRRRGRAGRRTPARALPRAVPRRRGRASPGCSSGASARARGWRACSRPRGGSGRRRARSPSVAASSTPPSAS